MAVFEGDEAEDLVTVVVSHDPNEAALLKGLLEDHGLVVATPGLEHRAMLGMAGSFVKIPIKVPRRDKAEAEALLAALEEESDGDADEGTEDGSDALPAEAPRQRRVALFVACAMTFGSGHFYVRENAAGLLLLVVEAVALALLCAGEPLGGVVVFGCIVADIGGSLQAVRRQERGQAKLSRASQVLRTLPALAVASAATFGVLQLLPEQEEEPPPVPMPLPPTPPEPIEPYPLGDFPFEPREPAEPPYDEPPP